MAVTIREYQSEDIPEMIIIWNQVVAEGIAFPQTDLLDDESGRNFFDEQTTCGVAVDDDGRVVGLYIVHPNNIGRCGHIANASYAVNRDLRGQHVGEKLVRHSLDTARDRGFKIMQFNAVVASNMGARHLYEKIGFVPLGIIPKGFRMIDGSYEDICPYYYEL